MIAILSPALNMRLAQIESVSPTQPFFLQEAAVLTSLLQEHSPWELESLLRINPQLALQAWAYYQQIDAAIVGTPALAAFQGLAFQHVAPEDFTPGDYTYAQEHLAILSALYGLLRPCDGIAPYRLDFASRVKIEGKTLYAFWGDRIYRQLFSSGRPVINLCSAEYHKAVAPYLQPGDRYITCRFLLHRGGRLRCLATASKMARGEMARYIIKNRLERPGQLCTFSWEGYRFSASHSTEEELIFIQD